MTAVEEQMIASPPRVEEEETRRSLWEAVEALVDRTPDVSHLVTHRLHLFAARRRRELGKAVPASLQEAEWMASIRTLAAPAVLQRAREAYDDAIVLYKGPAAGAFYPDPTLRPFSDLDLLVADAAAAQQALLAHGFEEFGDPELFIDIHHLRPLRWPGLPVYIEIHDRPKWPEHIAPPPMHEILAAGVETELAQGVLTPPPKQHALLLAAHAWAHEPLRRLIDVVDVAAAADAADREEISALARSWGLERIWKTTIEAGDSLFGGSRPSRPLQVWARHLRTARERTVLESHLEHWLSTFAALPPRRAARLTLAYITDELRPAPGETLRQKMRRTRQAFRRAFVARAEHNRILGEDARKPRRRQLRE